MLLQQRRRAVAGNEDVVMESSRTAASKSALVKGGNCTLDFGGPGSFVNQL